MRNPFKKLDFPDKVMLFLAVFLIIVFAIDYMTSETIELKDTTEVLKSIGEVFGK